MSSDKITVARDDLERVRDSLRWCRQWGTGTPAELETERCITILDTALSQPAEVMPSNTCGHRDCCDGQIEDCNGRLVPCPTCGVKP